MSGALLRNPIGFLLIPQFTVIALSSAIEPLRIANRYLAQPYQWRLLSLDGGPVADHNGIEVRADVGIAEAGGLGTLIICADLQPERWYDAALRRFLHRLDREGATLGALDTGSFLLARAGLLQGHRVTMHWEVAEVFGERYPSIPVSQTLYEVDGRRLTCAGGTAVLDMMLHAIALDHGTHLANRVAEHCLHDHIRTGSSQQRMATPSRSGVFHPKLVQSIRLLEAVTDRAVAVSELADATGLSSRQLLRLFEHHLAEAPARFHRRIRLEKARRLLTRTDLSVTDIAVACGFQSVAHFCRAYRSLYACTPGHDRRQLRPQRRIVLDSPQPLGRSVVARGADVAPAPSIAAAPRQRGD